MASTPEGKVKEKARKLYRQYGAACFQPAQMGMGSNGTPDQLVCRNDGHFGGIETKAGTWRVSALQRIRLEEIAAAGGSSMVVRETNLDMLEQWLRQPGWRVNAILEGEVCVGHVATAPGHQPVEIKNPGPKRRGKNTEQ